MDRLKKVEEVRQAMREALIRDNGEPLPLDAVILLYVFDAAAYVNVILLGRDPSETIEALKNGK